MRIADFCYHSVINHSLRRRAFEALECRSAAATYLHAYARALPQNEQRNHQCAWDLWCDRARIHRQSIALHFAGLWKVDLSRIRALTMRRPCRECSNLIFHDFDFAIRWGEALTPQQLRANVIQNRMNYACVRACVYVLECRATAVQSHSLLLFISICFSLICRET